MADLIDSIPHLLPSVSVEQAGADFLAFDGETLSLLSDAAAVVVRAVDGLRSVQGITELVSSATGRPFSDALPEVLDALQQLVDLRVLETHVRASEDGVRCPDHVGWCEDGARVVLVDLRSGDRHALDTVGAFAWQSLVTQGSIAATSQHLASVYSDALDLGDDVSHLASELVARGLLERA